MTTRRRRSLKIPILTIVHRRMTRTVIPTLRKRARAKVKATRTISWRRMRRSLQRVNWTTNC